MRHQSLLLLTVALLLALHSSRAGLCQVPEATAPQDDEPTVQLAVGDDVELKVLVDLVSEELGIRILYDEQIVNKKITIRSPGEIPVASLLGLLQSALKMKQLVLVDSDTPGWKRIEQTTRLPEVAPLTDVKEAIEQFGPATPVTQVFLLENADPTQVDLSIKPFLTQAGANSLALKEFSTLIVTDFATNIQKIAKLIELIDQPRPEIMIEFIPVKHVDVQSLSEQVSQIFLAGQGAAARGVPGASVAGQNISPDVRTNQLVVTGTQ